jgi:DNA-directed RNA polymerase subunit RPC12/RpoP
MSSDTEKLLINLGFRRITARYGGTCTNCSQPYVAGDDVYWKREESKTYVVCPKCYSKKSGASIM